MIEEGVQLPPIPEMTEEYVITYEIGDISSEQSEVDVTFTYEEKILVRTFTVLRTESGEVDYDRLNGDIGHQLVGYQNKLSRGAIEFTPKDEFNRLEEV